MWGRWCQGIYGDIEKRTTLPGRLPGVATAARVLWPFSNIVNNTTCANRYRSTLVSTTWEAFLVVNLLRDWMDTEWSWFIGDSYHGGYLLGKFLPAINFSWSAKYPDLTTEESNFLALSGLCVLSFVEICPTELHQQDSERERNPPAEPLTAGWVFHKEETRSNTPGQVVKDLLLRETLLWTEEDFLRAEIRTAVCKYPIQCSGQEATF